MFWGGVTGHGMGCRMRDQVLLTWTSAWSALNETKHFIVNTIYCKTAIAWLFCMPRLWSSDPGITKFQEDNVTVLKTEQFIVIEQWKCYQVGGIMMQSVQHILNLWQLHCCCKTLVSDCGPTELYWYFGDCHNALHANNDCCCCTVSVAYNVHFSHSGMG